jgi:hypothetical protein
MPPTGRVLRVPGDHNSVLNDPSTVRRITDLVESTVRPEGDQP